ncbi:hypothetical protein GQ43DRAFT_80433 [Delitschia confertaspora ATCC 74209]|uniref:Arrestin-like N-terminal domain-containing protein n=1 Tax=Delitschia confertaspora ATCC 74209 TaxID=1513339 RepID=A0A9P4JLA7_9PLEO|nr:hypothetical protein GQ43DRAFT_80433 [Delitschia confertaspora ATCC 74209]
MIVQILLDTPHAHFTNLDILTGRVILRNPTTSNISSIVVKLEGESRTRLLAPTRPDRPERQRPVLEVHKILYKTQVVWPQNQPAEDLVQSKATYTLNAGQYEYPFEFKLPLNNSCRNANNSLATNVNFTGLALEVARPPTRHVKQTLPPSLNGLPGEAEIRYYVKVTVNRPQFFKENPRAWANFTFLPIEPPRPAQQNGEAYARRTHQFLEPALGTPVEKKKSFFGNMRNSSNHLPTSPSLPPPRFTVDARLPNPAILTCNQELPLRILVKSHSEQTKNVYMQMLQIELIGYTKVQAHEVQRTESNSWVVVSMSNMAIPLGSPSDPVGTEVPINPEYWSGKTLPNTVAPSFQTCNISRYYELEVRVGLGYGSYEHGRDQLVVLPLRLPVKVYSGIAPPPALLKAMSIVEARKEARNDKASTEAEAPMNLPTPTPTRRPAPQIYTEPSVGPSNHQPPPSPGGYAVAGGHAAHTPQPVYDDAPPSYEEAIGQDLPPINGYRGEYQPPPFPEGEPGRLSGDHKRT